MSILEHIGTDFAIANQPKSKNYCVVVAKEGICLDWLPPHLRKKKYLDAAATLLSMIHYIQSKKNMQNKMVEISTDYMCKVIGRHNAVAIRDHMIHAGLLVVNNHYIPGSKSRQYDVSPLLKPVAWTRYQVTDIPQVNRIRKHFSNRNLPSTDIEYLLYNCLTRIMIDNEVYNKIEDMSWLRESGWKENWIQEIDKLSSQDWRFSRDRFGRLHTSITNLNKQFKKYLSVDNCKLVELDIGSSQPYFLGRLILEQLTNSYYIKSINFISPPPLSPHYGYHFLAEDLKEYLHLVTSQKDDLFTVIQQDCNSSQERSEFKDDFYRDVFYQKYNYCSKSKDAFTKRFPTVMNFMQEIKKENPNNASHMMQRAESEFVIEKVCKYLFERYPNIWLATIHDAILTTKEYENIVYNAMQELATPLPPKVRITRY